jgi:hypothetical protein
LRERTGVQDSEVVDKEVVAIARSRRLQRLVGIDRIENVIYLS